MNRADAGLYWEDVVARHLRARGLAIIKRRYRCRLGELDLVCRDAETLVVVEVRARSRNRFASSAASVDVRKRRRIIQATRHLLMRHPELSGLAIRFDVFAVDGIDSEPPTLNWIKNAFDLS